MDLIYLKKLIKMLDSSNLSEIEIEEEGTKLKLSKPKPQKQTFANIPPQSVPLQAMPASNNNAVQEAPGKTVKEESAGEPAETPSSDNLFEVKSPMVGTFYRAPAPDADPYLNVGDTISQGSVLCIVEAMKLMNEIESEVSGKVVKILVEDSQAVEYNQPLFLIEV